MDPKSLRNNKNKTQEVSTLKGFYIVEKILDKKNTKQGLKYKIKWMNFPMEQSIFFLLFFKFYKISRYMGTTA